MPKKTLVLNFGGSIFSPAPAKIDFKVLKNLNKLTNELKNRFRLIIVVGGGKTSRHYQNIALKAGIKEADALDWVGVRLTHLNAEFIKASLGKDAFSQVITSEEQSYEWNRGILVSGGWRPGRSTDFVASKLALRHNAESMVVATNVDFIYNKDPKIYPDARKIKDIRWQDFEKIVPSARRWTPGMSAPLDPEAVKVCKKNKMRIIFLDGRKFKNILRAVKGESFSGTLVF